MEIVLTLASNVAMALMVLAAGVALAETPSGRPELEPGLDLRIAHAELDHRDPLVMCTEYFETTWSAREES